MTLYQHIKFDLFEDEGIRLKPYRCTAGKLTIGVGRNLDDNGITSSEAAMLLDHDIENAMAELDKKLPWWKDKPDSVRRVMVNMCFNLGITGLLTFKNTLALIEADRYPEAAENMLKSRWAVQVGARANRLAKLMREAKWGDSEYL